MPQFVYLKTYKAQARITMPLQSADKEGFIDGGGLSFLEVKRPNLLVTTLQGTTYAV